MGETRSERYSPQIEVPTAIGDITLNYDNARLMIFPEEKDIYLAYYDGRNRIPLKIMDYDWDVLIAAKFPWDYTPLPPKDWTAYGYESLDLTKEGRPESNSYDLTYELSSLCLFADSHLNHIEHRVGNNVMGLSPDDKLLSFAFSNLRSSYRPYPDERTLAWYEAMHR